MIRHPNSIRRERQGFTMIEATLASVIVAALLVVTMSSVAASRGSLIRAADRLRAKEYALDLMAEILQQTYQSSSAVAARPAWTAVNQYNSFTETPLQTKTGTAIPDTTGWSRSVTVQWIDPTSLQPTSNINTGILLITVTVQKGTTTLATVAAYRTSGWVDHLPSPSDATGNHPPVASATANPLSGRGGHLTVNFNGSASSDPDGDSLSYVWTFGDGADASAVSPSHNYTAVGAYTATLTVYDGRGGVGISSLTISVTP
jgi:PKD repeat protein